MNTPRYWIDTYRPHPEPDSVYIHGLFDEDQIRMIQCDALESAARLHENINPDGSGGSMGAIIRFRDAIRALGES